MDVPSVFDGPVNGHTFRAQDGGVLVPLRMPGDVEVMGNLGHHKSKAGRKAIREVGAHLLFLPPFSPDLNPVERAFSKLNHWMQTANTRERDILWRTLGTTLDQFTRQDCLNHVKRWTTLP